MKRSRVRWAARAGAGVLGAGLLYQAGVFLLGAAGVLRMHSSPVVWLALGLLCSLPGTALAWFAAGRQFAVWEGVPPNRDPCHRARHAPGVVSATSGSAAAKATASTPTTTAARVPPTSARAATRARTGGGRDTY